jgi:hypothetical protein
MKRVLRRVGGFLRWLGVVTVIAIAGFALAVAAVTFLVIVWPEVTQNAGDAMVYVSLAGVVVALLVGAGIVYFAYVQRVQQKFMLELAVVPVMSAYVAPTDTRGGQWVQDLQVQNVGNGPAMDLDATLYGRIGEEYRSRHVVLPTRRHIEKGGAEVIYDTGVEKQEHNPLRGVLDVWILHYADLNGNHWHSWCNWDPEEDRHVPTGTFVFRSRLDTPSWIGQHCERCVDLGWETRGGLREHLDVPAHIVDMERFRRRVMELEEDLERGAADATEEARDE